MKLTTLSSLAFLKVNWDLNQNGFLDNFLPLMNEVIKSLPEGSFTPTAIQEPFQNMFGLKLPVHVITSLLLRATKRNLVRREGVLFFREKDLPSSTNFIDIQNQVHKVYTNIINKFKIFASTTTSVDLSPNQIEDLLIAFLSYNQLDLYGSTAELVLPNIMGLTDSQKILIGSFINVVVLTDENTKNDFQTIVIGYMLANAIYLPDPNQVQSKFHNTSFYFDTSYLMHALGYDGIELETPSIELLELLRVHRGKLFCFRHTIDEIIGILIGCSERMKLPHNFGISKLESHFLNKGYSSSDVLLESNNIEKRVQNLNIKIVEKPDYSDYDHAIDEKELSEDIDFCIGYQNEKALERDVASISSIYRLRKGRLSQSIENCYAIFVTTNNKLSFSSNSYFFKLNKDRLIPPCINDFTLTTILWLKTPIQRPNLPFSRIIADSIAAIQPSKTFLTKWFSEIDKLNQKGEFPTEDDYYYMRHAPEVHRNVMELTMGDSQNISEGNIKNIIERTRKKFELEITEKFDQKLDFANKKTMEIGMELNTLKEKEQQRNKKILDAANRKANIIRRLFQILNAVISIIFSLPIILPFISANLPFDIQLVEESICFFIPYCFIVWFINFSRIGNWSIGAIEEKYVIKYRDSLVNKLKTFYE